MKGEMEEMDDCASKMSDMDLSNDMDSSNEIVDCYEAFTTTQEILE